jgi:hypothetical protein
MVALKFLLPHISLVNEVKERFFHKAQEASALDYNNIKNSLLALGFGYWTLINGTSFFLLTQRHKANYSAG